MEQIGICLITNRKIIKINDELKSIFKIKEMCLGGLGKDYFIPFTGNLIGEEITTNWRENDIGAFYIDYLDWIKNEKAAYDIKKTISEYLEGMEQRYYELNGSEGLTALLDEAVIEEVKKIFNETKEEFSENRMNDDSDISKMYKDIKKTIISQDKQIMMILTSLYKNNRVINSNLSDDVVGKLKENILIVGPTGTGKTEILTRISKRYDVPIVIEDSTSVSETGYVGRKVEDYLRNLYLTANKDLKKAERGILVLDEFDKLAEKGNQEFVSRSGVQRSLLKILDGSKVYFDDIEFDTSKLTIVALGAFSKIKDKKDYDSITTDDLVKYGLMQEIVGRFSKVIKMNSLSKEDLKVILIASDLSPINTYKEFFDEIGVEFEYDDGFIDYIAEQAQALDTGARALKKVFDEQISGALFNVFSGDYQGISLTSPDENGICYHLKKTPEEKKLELKKK